MRMGKKFVLTIAMLAGVLLLQAWSLVHEKPGPRYVASWKNIPKNIDEAKNLASQIVLGRVTRVRRAEDLVVEAPGEPKGEDRIPIEAVTIRLEKSYKGARPQTIEVFHTGLSVGIPVSELRPPRGPAPPKPEDGVDRPARLPIPSKEASRTILLEEDPPYERNQRYLLLLTDGPEVIVGGTRVKTKAVISPEGRYRITENDRVEPVTRRGFAGARAGRLLRELEAEVR